MSIISVEGMEFHAYHGCFPEEQHIGTKFIVDVFLEADTLEAEITDDLSKTINYQSVYILVKAEMEVNSKLIENVSRRILDSIMKAFPEIHFAEIRLSKMNPPLGGKVESVSVTISSEDSKLK
jgi:dihydroneopterin aldolase